MTIKITIDDTKIEYRQPKSAIGKAVVALGGWFRKVSLITLVNPPYKFKGFKKWFSILRFDQIGKTIRITPKTIEEGFIAHNERLKLYNLLSSTIYISTSIILVIIITATAALTSTTIQSEPLRSLFASSFNILSGILGLLVAVLSIRIAGLLLDKRFADSLILASSLYLVIDLQKHNSLSNPDYRRTLLQRIRVLRTNIVLLSQTFTASSFGDNQEAVFQLRSIEAFVRERENWVITPKKNTLELLRRDFDKLALLLISGQYGEFKPKVRHKTKETIAVPATFTDRVMTALFFLFPYGILLVLYFKPEYIASLGLNITTTFLVAIVWILLTIDAHLKLGFVERAAGLAKTMKELR